MALPHALRTGFANATGEYLTWTSDDNIYNKEAIEKMLSFLKNKGCSFIYCDFYKFTDGQLSNKILIELVAFNKIGASTPYRVLARIRFSKRVNRVLRGFKTREISFRKAKLELEDIVDGC